MCERQLKVAKDILTELRHRFSLPNEATYSFNDSRYHSFKGDFKKKISIFFDKHKYKRPWIASTQLKFRKVELQSVTGCELLRFFSTICRDETKIEAGKCFVVSINGVDEFALISLEQHYIELTTPWLNGFERRGFRKFFDEKYCVDQEKKFPEEYGKRRLQDFRNGFPENFREFFQRPVEEVKKVYRYACYGLLFEMVKPQMERRHSPHLNKIIPPVAQLIYIAIFNQKCQVLQSIFGDHNLPGTREEKMSLRAIQAQRFLAE